MEVASAGETHAAHRGPSIANTVYKIAMVQNENFNGILLTSLTSYVVALTPQIFDNHVLLACPRPCLVSNKGTVTALVEQLVVMN